jgi:hypothetical protein
MVRGKVIKTAWAKRFLAEKPSDFDEACDLACTPELKVELCFTDEAWTTGKFFWVINVVDQDFWLDIATKKEPLIALCKRMGWVITNP